MIPTPDHLTAIVHAATRRVNGDRPEPQDVDVLEVPWETVLQLAEALLACIGELDTTDELLEQLERENGHGPGIAQRREAIARVLLSSGGRA